MPPTPPARKETAPVKPAPAAEAATEAELLSEFIAGLPDFDPNRLPKHIPVRFLGHLLGIKYYPSVLQLISRGEMVTVHGARDTPGKGRYAAAWVDREEFLAWARETHRLTADNRPNTERLADIARRATSIDYDKRAAGADPAAPAAEEEG
jgi:hypothetical protein